MTTTMHHPKLDELVRRDPRYTFEAYEFVFAALAHTYKCLRRRPPPRDEEAGPAGEYHVTGRELLDGVRDLALREYGLMARTVLRFMGIHKTDDVGEIVFNLVEVNLMSKTAADERRDFAGVYDLDAALVDGYRIPAFAEAEDDG